MIFFFAGPTGKRTILGSRAGRCREFPPGFFRHRHPASLGRGVFGDDFRPSADGRFLHRRREREIVPADLQDEFPRNRGHRAAGGRRVPQPRVRQHQEDLPDAGLQKSLRTATNVHNPSEVLFHLTANTDPQRDNMVAVRKDSPKARLTCSTTRRAKSPAAAKWVLTRRRKFLAKVSNAPGRR